MLMDKQKDTQTEVCMDGRTHVQIPPMYYRTLSPFGAEALLT